MGCEYKLDTTDYKGRRVVMSETAYNHACQYHADDSSGNIDLTDVQACVEEPHFVVTNPVDHDHPDRYNYYRVANQDFGPKYRRVIVDHSDEPSRVKTTLRTNEVSKFGEIVVMNHPQGQ